MCSQKEAAKEAGKGATVESWKTRGKLQIPGVFFTVAGIHGSVFQRSGGPPSANGSTQKSAVAAPKDEVCVTSFMFLLCCASREKLSYGLISLICLFSMECNMPFSRQNEHLLNQIG